jgi:hypothetical protein
MIKENAKAIGVVTVKLLDKDGNVKEDFTVNNLVVDTGTSHIISRMLNNTATPMSHMAIGTGISTPTVSDIALGAEAARDIFTSVSTTGATIEYNCTFGAGVGTGNITEAGIFNAASSGTMLNRVTFGSVNKGSLDTMLILWSVTIG